MKSKKNYYFWYYNNHKTTKTMENNNANQAPATNNMAVGILSYLGILWVVAYILNNNGKTAYGALHLRQGLGILLIYVAMWIVFFILGMALSSSMALLGIIGMVSLVIYLGVLVLVILGIINAATNKMNPLPVVGGMFEKWFAGIK
jgi:hypothetical protein